MNKVNNLLHFLSDDRVILWLHGLAQANALRAEDINY